METYKPLAELASDGFLNPPEPTLASDVLSEHLNAPTTPRDLLRVCAVARDAYQALADSDLGELVGGNRTKDWVNWLFDIGTEITSKPSDFSRDLVRYFQPFSSPRAGRPDVGSGLSIVGKNPFFTLLGLERDVHDLGPVRSAYAAFVRTVLAAREIALQVNKKNLNDASLISLTEIEKMYLPALMIGMRSSNTLLTQALEAIGDFPGLTPVALRRFSTHLKSLKTTNTTSPLGQGANPRFIKQLTNLTIAMRQGWVLLGIQMDPTATARELSFTPFEGWDGADKHEIRLQIYSPEFGSAPAPVVTLPDTPAPNANDAQNRFVPSTRAEEQWARMIASAFRNYRANFPYAWSNLNPIEISVLEKKLTEIDDNTSEKDRPGANAILNLLQIGAPTIPTQENRIGTATRSIAITQPPDAFVPSSMANNHYLQVGEKLLLSIKAPNSFEPDKIDGGWPQSALGNLGLRRSIRASKQRLGNHFYNDVLAKTNDLVLARRLRANPSDVRPDDYYSAFFTENLNQKFPHLHFTTPNATAFGARGVPDLDVLSNQISAIKQEIKLLQQSNDDISVRTLHNLYVLYTALYWELISTHRPVNDPFYSSRTIFPEQNFVLIADKVATASHAVRLGLWTPLAESHRLDYDKHLRTLAAAAKAKKPEFSTEILKAANCQKSKLPYLFFVLEDRVVKVSHRTMSYVAGELWPFQESALRSAFATHGRRTIDPEVVDALLGHWPEDQAPFSKFSATAWPEIALAASPKIDELARKIGFEPIQGLPAAHFTLAKTEAQIANITFKHRALGPEKREAVRSQRKNRDKVVVAAAIKYLREEIEANPSSDLLTQATEHAKREICNSKGSGRDIERRLRILNRYLRRLRVRQDNPIAVPVTGLAMAPRASRPVVTDHSGLALRAFMSLRDQFAPWLERTLVKKVFSNKSSIENRARTAAASALVSAVLYGGLSKKHIDTFVEALLSGRYFRYQGLDWLELTNSKEHVFRFVGDYISRSLLALTAPDGEFSDAMKTLQHRDVKRRAADILQLLQKQPGAVMIDQPLERLNIETVATWGVEYFPTMLPGVLASYLRGDLATRSLALEPFLRVISGGAIDRAVEWKPDTGTKPRYRPKIVSGFDAGSQKQLAGELVSILRWRGYQYDLPIDEVKKAQSPVELKKKRKAHRQLQNQLYRKHVTPLLSAFNERLKDSGCWPIIWYLTRHARELVQRGGEATSILHGDTVVDYISTNAANLVLAFGPQDPIDMDEDDRQQCYEESLPRAADPDAEEPRKHRKRCLIRLSTFDKFLMREYGIPPINWKSVSADMANGLDFVHANLVTFQDFERLIGRLSEHHNALHVGAKFCALKMYCAGLRNGEAERAPSDDHLFCDEASICYVRTVDGAKPKTPSGTRQTSLDATASKQIKHTYDEIIELLGPKNIDDSNFTLVNAPSGAGGLGIEREQWATLVRRTLIEVTGDPHIRVYSLRHGHATRLTLLALRIPHPRMAQMAGFETVLDYLKACDELRQRLTNTSNASPLLLDAIAMHLGQLSFETTAHSYVHSFEVMTSCALDQITPDINMKTLATFIGVSYDNVRKSNSRLLKSDSAAQRFQLLPRLKRKHFSPEATPLPKMAFRGARKVKELSRKMVFQLDFMSFAKLAIDLANGEFEELSQRYNIQANDVATLETIVCSSLLLNTFQPLDGSKSKEKVMRGLERIQERLPLAIDRLYSNVGTKWMDDILILSPSFLTADDSPLLFRSENLRDYVGDLFKHLLTDNFEESMKDAHRKVGAIRGFSSDRLRADEKRVPLEMPPITLGENATKSKQKIKGKSSPHLGYSKPALVGIRNWKLLIWICSLRLFLGDIEDNAETQESR